jgi:hypothetical protein
VHPQQAGREQGQQKEHQQGHLKAGPPETPVELIPDETSYHRRALRA